MNLVTGGSGFIGGHLVTELRRRGEPVRVLDIDPKEPPSGVELVRGSVTNRDDVRAAMRGVRRVFHVAGNPNLWASAPGELERVNAGGTRIVLEEAARQNVEMSAVTSSAAIHLHGQSPEHLRIDDMPGAYSRSKLLAEQVALAAAERGQPVIVVSPTIPIGPGDHNLTPPTRMILDFLEGRNPAFLDFSLNLIDVRDVALGHIAAVERGTTGERYVLGNATLDLSTVLAKIQALTGVPMPRFRIPYLVAYLAALVSEFASRHLTHSPPRAPMEGVLMARQAALTDRSGTLRGLGIAPIPLEHSLQDAITWLSTTGRIHRPLVLQSA